MSMGMDTFEHPITSSWGWSGWRTRVESDTLLFGGEPQDKGSTADRLNTGSEPHSSLVRHPLAPPFLPYEGRVLFLGN